MRTRSQTTDSGETMFVDDLGAEVGSKGPSYGVYRSDERAERYGCRCSACGTLDNAMDTTGRPVPASDRIRS